MKGKYGGPISVDELFQALFQDRDFFRRHKIAFVRVAYLYFTPCDANGMPVTVTDEDGTVIDGYESAGGYRPAADAYDAGSLEARPVTRAPRPGL